MQPPVTPPSRPAVPRLSEPEVGRPEDGKLPSVSVHQSVHQLVFSAQTEQDVPHLNVQTLHEDTFFCLRRGDDFPAVVWEVVHPGQSGRGSF